jgi:DNA (cytosine-5)-methyltransferase 1
MSHHRFTSIASLSHNKGANRFWVEGHRLCSLGFVPGTPILVEKQADRVLITRAEAFAGTNRISSRGSVPVLDINSDRHLDIFDLREKVKLRGTFGRMVLERGVHATHLRDARAAQDTFRVLELFAGGGTMGMAIEQSPELRVVGALEYEADYLNAYSMRFAQVEELLQGDVRDFDAGEFPRHEILVAGIPCDDHSLEGRAKKGLTIPEEGAFGNLYMEVLPVIRHHRPRAVIVENVPSFANSIAGVNMVRTLQDWGYGVANVVIDPIQWGEITGRKRWVMVAMLDQTFQFSVPAVAPSRALADFLDPEDPIADAADVANSAHGLDYLRNRSVEMEEKGNGWRHQTLPRNAVRVPTLCKNYMKRQPNSWAVQTAAGDRFLRAHEIARIHGHTFPGELTKTTVAEMSGQGVLTRVFADLFREVVRQLRAPSAGLDRAIRLPLEAAMVPAGWESTAFDGNAAAEGLGAGVNDLQMSLF